MNLLDPRFLKIVNYYVVPVDPKPYDPKYGIDGYKRGVIVYVSPKNLEKILKGENILIRKNEESDNNVFYYPKGYEKSYKKIYGESYNLEKIVGLSVKVEQDLYTTI